MSTFQEVSQECLEAARFQLDPSKASIEDILLSAIMKDRLKDLLKAWEEDRQSDSDHQANQAMDVAQATLSNINHQIQTCFVEVSRALASAGITCQRVEKQMNGAQFHAFSIRITSKDLHKAFAVLQTLGFPFCAVLSSGAVAALANTSQSIELLQDGDTDMRLTVSWQPTSWAEWLPKRLIPVLHDVCSIHLPRSLWPAYVLAKITRAFLRRLSGFSGVSSSRPVLPQANLGTPNSLIYPMMQAIELTKEDRLVDFGCGDGRVIAVAAKEFGCDVIGIESNASLAAKARAAIADIPNDRAHVEHRVGTAQDVAQASVAFLFLPMNLVVKFIPGILQCMPKGGRIVVHEQTELPHSLTPDHSIPVFSENAMTVVHIWNV